MRNHLVSIKPAPLAGHASPLLALVIASCLLFGAAAQIAPESARATPTGSCQMASTSGDSTVTLVSDDSSRTAILHLPAAAAGHALPLLIALHGTGGTGAKFERDTGFSGLADRDGFAVVYPSSYGQEWDISQSSRDVDFISDLLDQIQQLACINPQRVYATGVSNGGGMAARLGCDLSDRIAGIASVAGGYRSLPACNPDRPVSVLEIHGTADTTVPYSGSGPQHAGAVLPYIFGWASRDGCQPSTSGHRIAAHTVRYLWSGCRGGATVEHLRIYGGKHGMPDATGAEISSGGAYTISGADQVWRFLAPVVLSPPSSSVDAE
jgi:polyhydroxybutyrate depolymerase